jgi:hypothetical protein
LFTTVNPGDRHKLAAIRVSGNRFFSDEQIRSRMQDQAAGRLFSHGRYSEAFLEEDVRGIENLYRASGFRQVKSPASWWKVQGDPSLLAIDVASKKARRPASPGYASRAVIRFRRNSSRKFHRRTTGL